MRDSSTPLGMKKKQLRARTRASPPTVKAPLQSKHILHRIKPGRFIDDPLGCVQRAASKNFSAAGTMRQLHSLTRPGKDDRVLAHHITLTNRSRRDFVVDLSRFLQNFRERFRRPARRVFLHAMVRLNNFDTKLVAKNFRGVAYQSKKGVHADAKVGC